MDAVRTEFFEFADKLFSRWIIARDGYVCFWCGLSFDGSLLDCGHVITRGNKILRWEPLNAVAICRNCHIVHWHKNESEAQKTFARRFPERWEIISKMKNGIGDVSEMFLREIVEKFSELPRAHLGM